MASTISSIKEQVALYKGLRVRYRTAKGRRKVEERQGIVLETYPNLFTLYVESQDSKVSFSYAELLTREVELESPETGSRSRGNIRTTGTMRPRTPCRGVIFPSTGLVMSFVLRSPAKVNLTLAGQSP